MSFGMIIVTFEYMLNAKELMQKLVKFLQKAQLLGTALNFLKKDFRFQTSQIKMFLTQTARKEKNSFHQKKF